MGETISSIKKFILVKLSDGSNYDADYERHIRILADLRLAHNNFKVFDHHARIIKRVKLEIKGNVENCLVIISCEGDYKDGYEVGDVRNIDVYLHKKPAINQPIITALRVKIKI